jgi:hypothetical protein
MGSRHPERYLTQPFTPVMSDKRRAEPGHPDVARPEIGLGALAIGNEPLVYQWDNVRHIAVVQTEHGKPIERHLIDEFDKGFLYLVNPAVKVQMVGIYIGDHGNGR